MEKKEKKKKKKRHIKILIIFNNIKIIYNLYKYILNNKYL